MKTLNHLDFSVIVHLHFVYFFMLLHECRSLFRNDLVVDFTA